VRPLIGISTYARAGERPCFSVPCTYVDAVVAAGGIPVLLPPVACAATVLEGLDGLLLPGGGDVTPDHYGGAAHATNYDVCSERDAFELALVRAALGRDGFPMLGICRGMQILNVALGGDLVPHLPEQYGEDVAHRARDVKPVMHPVTIDAQSLLGGIHGATQMIVHSIHHQAVRRLGDGLRAVAWSPDGVVEAIESPAHVVMAVQWHPELDGPEHPARRVFGALVERARDYARAVMQTTQPAPGTVTLRPALP
jgi:putative glutamine amidotransferase